MIAVCAAKFVGYVCKKMGRQGVTWAGKVAIASKEKTVETFDGIQKDVAEANLIKTVSRNLL